ncbi:UpxY family transcription antiterminator [Flavisolibacter sp. BT320]|nr:UpxY family transcription antiterminator [Flavisolibacter longurius]
MQDWLVIQIRPRWEKKVARQLEQKGIETYCPLVKERHQWSDRVKVVERPLFRSYVFVKISENQRTDVRLTPGVINFVYRNGKLVVLKERRICSIREFQQLYPEVRVLEKVFLERQTNSKNSGLIMEEKIVTLPLKVLDMTLVAFTGQQKRNAATIDNI